MPPRQFDGHRVRAVRRAAGLRQADLASALGLSKTPIVDWEDGKAAPHPDRLPAVAKALKQDIDTLFPRLSPPDLSDLRADAGYTQAQAAKALGIHRPPLSNAENGKRRLPADLMPRVADLYEVSLEEMEAAQDRSFGILTSTPHITDQTPRTLPEKIRFLLDNRRQVTDEAIASAINDKARAEVIKPATVKALRTEDLAAGKALEGLPTAAVFEGLSEAFGVPPFFFQSGEEIEAQLMERLRFLSLIRSEGVRVAARGAHKGISSDMLATVSELILRETTEPNTDRQ
ncbi:helix-turn-helix domain-containing protein [Streptantibioticus ferralitis]|uniref:Helix-turn-helix transcriptional regulator n=1 Tax=Streptantibioticus ferralitis TaxID=236510 RepID=A0ABT5Z1S1_9ACTN|nr:helix-turn-helix transcriptional regulator [Streptantibioticus ferralitis]MDF2257713.1 helix-turn-helix transcriptional regulator [Streptantibioticus ferralitis]